MAGSPGDQMVLPPAHPCLRAACAALTQAISCETPPRMSPPTLLRSAVDCPPFEEQACERCQTHADLRRRPRRPGPSPSPAHLTMSPQGTLYGGLIIASILASFGSSPASKRGVKKVRRILSPGGNSRPRTGACHNHSLASLASLPSATRSELNGLTGPPSTLSSDSVAHTAAWPRPALCESALHADRVRCPKRCIYECTLVWMWARTMRIALTFTCKLISVSPRCGVLTASSQLIGPMRND